MNNVVNLNDAKSHLDAARRDVQYAEFHIAEIKNAINLGGLKYSDIGTTKEEMMGLENEGRKINATICIEHGFKKKKPESLDFGKGLLREIGFSQKDINFYVSNLRR